MLRLEGSFDYYPTPEGFLDKITDGVKWENLYCVLEPSAGKGNIAEFLVRRKKKSVDFIDCVEIEPDLQAVLTGKGLRVIHDDFLTLHTYKHYDLILMNPPFSEGAKHLLKALDVQSVSGGDIICILNAETLRNPYTNERNLLLRRLGELKAHVTYYENAFSDAERPTNVEVAVVKVTVPGPRIKTTIFDTLREKDYEEYEQRVNDSELAPSDIVAAYVAQFNREIEWGLRLWAEYRDMQTGALDGTSPISFGFTYQYDQYGNFHNGVKQFSVNSFVLAVRRKYWDKFFKNPQITAKMTSNLQKAYLSKVDTFTNYDFSYFNVKTVMIDITKSLVKGVEDCILALFDELSAKHSWEPGTLNNVHYYDGWATNKSWYINKRVVLAYMRTWEEVWGRFSYSYTVREKLADIEKALNYLDSGMTEEIDLGARLQAAENAQQTKNVDLKFFKVTFYKKGTCHIEFKDERLLKKLNIFGSQRKGWLPSGYGRQRYSDMTKEEQHVIDSFEGAAAYERTVNEAGYFLFDASRAFPMLQAGR